MKGGNRGNLEKVKSWRCPIIIFYLLLTFQVFAQKQVNNWALADYEINFNSGEAIVSRNFASHLNRGLGVISDSNGMLLFYTDGYTVWNKNHQIMPNGFNLLPATGATSTQESIIIPKPDDPNIYYIITVDPYNGQTTSGIYYSEVDMSLADGLGGVTVKGTGLMDYTSNKLSATFHKNGKDIWVVAHRHNTNRYYKLLITSQGIPSQIKEQSIGPEHNFWNGQMKFSPDGQKMALSHSDGVSLFDFDSETGSFSNEMDFTFLDIDNTPLMVGLDFSSDSKKLYTCESRSDQIYQFNLSFSTFEEIKNSRREIGERIIYNSLRQFQLAPDGKIYITKGGGGGGTSHLGVIVNPNDDADAVIVKENGLYLEGGDSFVNYTPNFIQNYLFKTSFTYNSKCQGTKIDFRITNEHQLDSVKWDFGNGSTTKERSPHVIYASPGDYNVEMLAYYSGKADTVKKQITIDPFTIFDLGENVTLCSGVKLNAEGGFKEYNWSTGDTTRTTKVKQEGWYKLTVKNEFGCFFKDSLFIDVIELPVINLPDSATLLAGEVTLNPGAFSSYSWNTGETTPNIVADRSGWYSVAVTNSFGCKSAKSTFVIDPSVPVTQYTSDWIVLNPKPSSAIGRDISFIDDQIGYLVNDEEILQTKDGGNTWRVVQKIISGKKIAFKNSIGYTVGNYGSMYKSTHLGEGWNKVQFNFQDNLNGISLIHQDTIYVTSDSKLYVSNNGGKDWVVRNTMEYVDIEDSFFINSKIGHAACKGGTIIKTIDGGITWYKTITSNITPSDFFRIQFVNDNVGYATQAHSDIYKTIDGGETWAKNPAYLDAGYGLHFTSEMNGFIVGDHGAIHKTTDGGNTWNWAGFDGRKYANDLYAVHFIDENIGYAAGLRGRIIKTTNGGVTWKEYALTYSKISQLDFPTKDIGYASVGTQILKTIDSGLNWSNLGSIASGISIGKIDFVNETSGYAIVGTSVYRTNDGAASWTRVLSANQGYYYEHLNAIDFLDENIGYVGGGYNWRVMLRTTDGGATWSDVTNIQTNNSLGHIQILDAEVAYAKNTGNYYNRIFKTKDGGSTWEMIYEVTQSINTFYFIDRLIGYFVGDQGLMYKTIDGGISWQKVEVPYGDYINVKFHTPNFGYIINDDGRMYKSIDGGQTWIPEIQRYGLGAMEISAGVTYVGGEFGSILKNDKSFTRSISFGVTSVKQILDDNVTVGTHISSNFSLKNAQLKVALGIHSDQYTEVFDVELLNGFVDKEIVYNFEALDISKTYFCRFILVEGGDEVTSSEISFSALIPQITTGIDEQEQFVVIYPNPSNKYLTINHQEFDNASFVIMDALGRAVINGTMTETNTIDIEKLTPGVYLLAIMNDNRYLLKVRFVKQ